MALEVFSPRLPTPRHHHHTDEELAHAQRRRGSLDRTDENLGLYRDVDALLVLHVTARGPKPVAQLLAGHQRVGTLQKGLQDLIRLELD